MTECLINSVDIDESFQQPLIVNFQNGQLRSDQVDKLQCLAFRDKSNETLIASATENMTYVGHTNDADNLCYTLLTIRNKRTNKVRIVPVKNVTLNAVLSKENAMLDSSLLSKSTVGHLNKQFGSKKSKRKTEQYERLQMNVSHIEKELQETVADVKINPDDLIVPTEDDDKFYRPTINRNASTVENIYDINTIISKQELDTLEELATQVIDNPIEQDKFSPFVYEKMTEIKKSYMKNKIKKIELLLYIDAILKFFKINLKTIGNKRSCPIEPYPDTISTKVLKEFTVFVDNHRNRPLSMKDKAVCYCIVIALIALDFKLDLESLSKSINVGIKKLMDVSRVLGAQPLYTHSKSQIVLKLPLPPPPSIIRKKKNK